MMNGTGRRSGDQPLTNGEVLHNGTHHISSEMEDQPGPPGTPKINRINADFISLSWSAATGGGKPSEYTVEVAGGDQSWRPLVSHCRSTSVVVSAADLPETPSFRVRAVNKHGSSAPGTAAAAPAFADRSSQPPPDETKEVEGEMDEEKDMPAPFAHRHVTVTSEADFASQYEVQEELGRGRFGTVRMVVERATGVTLAAKYIKCRKQEDKESVREEIAIMNELDHPKLLQMAAAFEHKREMIMVLEYVSGGELFERVVADDFLLTERECIMFMKQICSGVQHMHSKNIMHLDMKPENILCISKSSHRIKIIDFGLACRYSAGEETHAMQGTPEFAPPEVINFERLTPASDMWSVGVICYVLLSGLSPFMGDTDAETFANVTSLEYDFDDEVFDDVSENAKDFISQLLLGKPRDRLSAEAALQHEWLASGRHAPPGAVLSTDKLKKFIIRRKWQKTGNAMLALGRLGAHLPGRGAAPVDS